VGGDFLVQKSKRGSPETDDQGKEKVKGPTFFTAAVARGNWARRELSLKGETRPHVDPDGIDSGEELERTSAPENRRYGANR